MSPGWKLLFEAFYHINDAAFDLFAAWCIWRLYGKDIKAMFRKQAH